MAGETIVVWNHAVNSPKILEPGVSSASVANAAMSAQASAGWSVETDGAGMPDADFGLVCSFGVAPTAGLAVSLFARPAMVDGVNAAPAPSAARQDKFLGNFIVDATTAVQYLPLLNVKNLPRNCTFYLLNQAGQTMAVAWKLYAWARSVKAAT